MNSRLCLCLLCSFFLSTGMLFTQGKDFPQLRQAQWQQSVDHVIHVELKEVYHKSPVGDIVRYELSGNQTITYTNHSPDTLFSLFFHLWPNAFRHPNTAFGKEQAAKGNKRFLLNKAQRGRMTLDEVRCRQEPVKVEHADEDISQWWPSQPVLPGESVDFTVKFTVLLPEMFSYLGVENGFISATHWYPKPAVYDVNGWNIMPYTEQGGAYASFGSYHIRIKVPEGFKVAACGTTETENAYHNPRVFEFKQDQIHDFAWFASKQFRITEDTLIIHPNTTIRLRVFDHTQKHADSIIKSMAESIRYFSREVAPYPYSDYTVVVPPSSNGSGQAYPGIALISKPTFRQITHLAGLQWFYGALGTNGSDHPWMDKSLSTHYENEYFNALDQRLEFEVYHMLKGRNTRGYYAAYPDKLLNLNMRRLGEDQPSSLPAQDFIPINYQSVVFGRNAHYIGLVKDHLGDAVFKQAMRDYYATWKNKHPLPGDIADAFYNSSGTHIDWLMQELLPAVGGSDFRIVYSKRVHDDTIAIRIHNATGLMVPLPIGLSRPDSHVVVFPFTIPPFQQDTLIYLFMPHGHFEHHSYVVLDPKHQLPENNRQLNRVGIPAHGFKKYSTPALKIRLSPTPENQYAFDLNINPALNYTMYSGFGLGVSAFNRLFPLKPFEYDLTAYVTQRTRNIIGNGSVGWNIIMNNPAISRIRLGVDMQRYDYRPFGYANTYNKLNPNLVVHLNHKRKLSQQIKKQIRVDVMEIQSDRRQFEMPAGTMDFPASSFARFLQVRYQWFDFHGLRPQSFVWLNEVGQVGLHTTGNGLFFGKSEGRYTLSLNQKGHHRKFKVQINAGLMWWNQGVSDIFMFRGSNNAGVMDYTFSETLLGRNETVNSSIWGQQLITAGGDLRINVPSFTGNHYVSVKLEQSLPVIPVLRVYVDAAFRVNLQQQAEMYWVGGLSAVLFEDIFEIYFPIAMSQHFRDIYDLNSSIQLWQRMCFKINLNFFYPRKNIELFRPLFRF
jgi:hypothetical protein